VSSPFPLSAPPPPVPLFQNSKQSSPGTATSAPSWLSGWLRYPTVIDEIASPTVHVPSFLCLGFRWQIWSSRRSTPLSDLFKLTRPPFSSSDTVRDRYRFFGFIPAGGLVVDRLVGPSGPLAYDGKDAPIRYGRLLPVFPLLGLPFSEGAALVRSLQQA